MGIRELNQIVLEKNVVIESQADRIKELERVLEKLITWNKPELGQGITTLMNSLLFLVLKALFLILF